jgi:hypothetical protein
LVVLRRFGRAALDAGPWPTDLASSTTQRASDPGFREPTEPGAGTTDGLEYLRFDCFENEPDYHYIEPATCANVVVRIDELAVGDPIEFSLTCVERQLPDMLRNCGVRDLADEVEGHVDKVRFAVTAVRDLMTEARHAVG